MSLRRRLLVWLLSGVLLGGLAAAAVVFYQAREQANALFDYQLRQLALTLRSYTPLELAQALQEAESPDFVIQIWNPDGELAFQSHRGLELPGLAPPGFSDVEARSGNWRVFTTWSRGLTIQVAQHKLAREALAFGAALRTFAPFALALPLMALLIWRLVGREVKVLARTAQAVAARTPESLEPIETGSVPEEVQPLVDSLNGLLGRLDAALSRQREFIADAAHELRTPLTALRLQLQLAERARDEQARARAHEDLRKGIARAEHVVQQLLTLARADPEAVGAQWGRVDLGGVALDVVEEHRAAAEAKGIALAAQAQSPVFVEGDRTSLRAMVRNLVDNALRYTASGAVTVRTRIDGNRSIVEVEDTGPGIPVAERERVFARFYRGASTAEGGGAGLGLAIVRRIAERHGGEVQLLDSPAPPGLLARISLPLSSA